MLVLSLLLVVREVGEPVLYHTIYLVLLFILARRVRRIPIHAPQRETARS